MLLSKHNVNKVELLTTSLSHMVSFIFIAASCLMRICLCIALIFHCVPCLHCSGKKQSAFKNRKEIEKKKTVKLKKPHFYLHISNSMNRFFFFNPQGCIFKKCSLFIYHISCLASNTKIIQN